VTMLRASLSARWCVCVRHTRSHPVTPRRHTRRRAR
jgi:hypothetical protein